MQVWRVRNSLFYQGVYKKSYLISQRDFWYNPGFLMRLQYC